MATSRIMGMANQTFAESFTDKFKDDTYVLILGNKDESSNLAPADGSYASSINSFFGDVGAVLPEYSAPYPVTRHHKWKQGIIWTPWDPTKDQEGQAYYCEHNRKVYLCLDNNSGTICNEPPKGTNPNSYTDHISGYTWQYMYSITGLMNHYLRSMNGTAWMPVPPIKTDKERKQLSSTDAYFLKNEVEKYGQANGGELLRIVVQEEAKRDLRWDSVSDTLFEPVVDPEKSAVINPVFEYLGPKDGANTTKRGHQLKRIDINNRGKGYPMSVSLRLGIEPSTLSQNATGYDSDHVVGGATSPTDEGIKGPFIYGVASPPNGFGDAVGLLYAYQSMFLVMLDPYALRQYTDSTSWNTAALVRNPLYKGQQIGQVISANTKSAQASYFSAATVIKTDNSATAQNFASGNKLSSIASAGNNTRVSGTVASNVLKGSKRDVRLTGQGADLVSGGDNLFTEQTNSGLISGKVSFSTASSSTPTSSTIDTVEKTPLSFGKDNLGRYPEVLHTFNFPSISLNPESVRADAGKTLMVALLVGGA